MCQVLCEPQRPLRFKNKNKIHEKSNRRERRGTQRMVNVLDALRTTASSALQKLTETFKTIDPSGVQS